MPHAGNSRGSAARVVLPAVSMSEAVSRSLQGRRESNEDAVLIVEELGLFLVADGMGGHQGGEVASGLAAETIAEFVRASSVDSQITWPFGIDLTLPMEGNRLRNAIQYANQRVRAEGRRQPELEGMGSTVVVALVAGDSVVHASVGDSRLYLLRAGKVQQLTTDDSWAVSMLRAGADEGTIKQHPMRHLLIRVIGADESLEIQVSSLTSEPDDLLIFCTDGLHGPLPDARIQELASDESQTLGARADALVEAALAAGGTDNVSVLLVRPQAHSPHSS